MSSNKNAKEKLIKVCGNVCFIEELGLRKPEDIERQKRYFGKKQLKIMDELTFHHIIERSQGGKTVFENGALLRNINHIWFNRLPKSQQEEINKLFEEYREYRLSQFLITAGELKGGEIIRTEIIVPDITDGFIEIPLKDDNKKYNRAKARAETKKKIEEGEFDWEYGEW